jgi:asparagine synthase (glutamine-hydrolysing)
MCGISGVWGRRDEAAVTAMLDRIRHRGPDDRGLLSQAQGVCGHNRLSIMDPAGGRHPIYNEDGSLAIVANGEIYNYPRLRRELEGRHRFATGNDSEVLLHLYEEEGVGMVHRLDGMFAFCIVSAEEMFLARDPIGIKPLYVADFDDAGLAFSSELKSLHPGLGEVREFPAGSWYHTRRGFRRFYSLPNGGVRRRTPAEHAAVLREALDRAVLERLMSDVPLGAFLSGGLDSSIIAALAAREIPGLHTFSVGLEGSPDLRAARTVAAHIGSQHHEYVMTEEEVYRKLPEILYHLESFDQDLVRSAIPCYFTSRLAAREVKVILTGEGADELFGGYTYYKDIDSGEVLGRELRRSVEALHNLNLQRVDRLTMAHSLEGRVPFLDLEVIAVAQTIPVELKLWGEPPVEKWILRKAYERLLPEPIVWRKKEQFDEGSGIAALMASSAEARMSDEEYATHLEEHPGVYLRSKEEAYYHRLFLQVYPEAEHILSNVGRWVDRPGLSTLPA